MMDMRLKNGPELLDLLDAMPKRMKSNIVRGGVRSGVVVLQTEARARVRRRSGRLARSLKVSTRVDGNIVSGKVAARGPGSYTAIFIERGVRPHWITVAGYDLNNVNARLRPLRSGRRRSDKTLMKHLNRMEREGSLAINGNLIGPYTHHPGHGAFPFMGPALDAKGVEAIEAIGGYIASRLTWDGLKGPELAVLGDEQ